MLSTSLALPTNLIHFTDSVALGVETALIFSDATNQTIITSLAHQGVITLHCVSEH